MDKSDLKTSALQDSPPSQMEGNDTVKTDDIVNSSDNIHTENHNMENDENIVFNDNVNASTNDPKDNEKEKAVVETQSYMSLSQSEGSLDGVEIQEESTSAGLEESKDISLDLLESERHISTNSFDCKDTFETKSVDTIDSSLFDNTQETLGIGYPESHGLSNDFLKPINSSYDQLSDLKKKEESQKAVLNLPSNQSPPRTQIPISPLLTSTPHSLPPLPRNRVSSTPCAPPSPLSSPYPSTSPSIPHDITDGPMSLPTMSHTSSKSYDYLLKVNIIFFSLIYTYL